MAASMMKSATLPTLRDNLLLLQGKHMCKYTSNYYLSKFFNAPASGTSFHDDASVRSYSKAPIHQTPTSITSGGSSSPSPSTSVVSASDRLGHIMQMYEDLVGLTEVKTAQDKVVDAERNFLKVQEERRTLQQEISDIQAEVRTVATELEKTHRTDPCYIDLVKKEHGILVKEKEMSTKLKTLDRCERDLFSLLSINVRESHEKERARAERTKYWSVIGSIIGAVIGITGSTINNHRRLKELRSIVKESGESMVEYKEIVDKMLAGLSSYSILQDVGGNNNNNNNASNFDQPFVADPLYSQTLQQCIETFHDNLNLKTSEILSGLVDIKKLVAVTQSSDGNPNVVYVGPEMKSMLRETELKLERDSKKNMMISLSVLGGIFTLGLSLIVFSFKGS